MKIDRILYFICSVLLILTVFITCIDVASFDRGFYQKEYRKYNNAEVIGITQEELDEVTDVLLGYIQDKNDDLTVYAKVKGEDREVFNAKEKLHMVDVKELYHHAMLVRNVGAIVVVLIFMSFILTKRFDFKELMDAFKVAGLFYLVILGCCCLWAITDFNAFWINFHYVFFDNELFFLDPSKDILIMMVPGGFFFDLVFRIVLYFVISMAVLVFLGYTLSKRGF